MKNSRQYLFKNKYRSSSSRASWWNYSTNAAYFVSICTAKHLHYFGKITDGKMQLSEIGKTAEQYWDTFPEHFPFVFLDEFVIMPNHIHGILIINKNWNNITNNVGAVSKAFLFRKRGVSPLHSRQKPKRFFYNSSQIFARLRAFDTTPNIDLPPRQRRFRNQGKNTLSSIIGSYKSIVTKNARKIDANFGWQSRFYDNIIRNEKSFNRIRNYIYNNPANWKNDRLYNDTETRQCHNIVGAVSKVFLLCKRGVSPLHPRQEPRSAFASYGVTSWLFYNLLQILAKLRTFDTAPIQIVCLILAAGAGKRYGMPKWQIEYKGKTFLEIIIDKVRKAGINNIVCVIRKDSVPNIKNIKYAINPKPEQGMFSSISIGIKAAHRDISGYLIIPVDHPFFEPSTVEKLQDIFYLNNSKDVIRPTFQEASGHPIIIPKTLAKKIPPGDYKGGLKKFIKDSNVSISNIEVNDPGILKNINTKKACKKAF